MRSKWIFFLLIPPTIDQSIGALREKPPRKHVFGFFHPTAQPTDRPADPRHPRPTASSRRSSCCHTPAGGGAWPGARSPGPCRPGSRRTPVQASWAIVSLPASQSASRSAKSKTCRCGGFAIARVRVRTHRLIDWTLKASKASKASKAALVALSLSQ